MTDILRQLEGMSKLLEAVKDMLAKGPPVDPIWDNCAYCHGGQYDHGKLHTTECVWAGVLHAYLLMKGELEREDAQRTERLHGPGEGGSGKAT